ncbi:MAG: DUF4917 family protein [Polynucleobacter sp.]
MSLETFEDVVKSIKKNDGRPFNLLLGNGFSMAYDSKIFSYNALHNFVENSNHKLLSKVFDAMKTKNFELMLQQLDAFYELAEALGADKKLKDQIAEASGELKTSLIEAVKELHPEHVFKVPEEKINACAKFIKLFLDQNGKLFTTNYDVLLYWVLMRSPTLKVIGDGFGRDREGADEYIPPEDLQYSELRWGKNKETQVVFYMHGALPIFDTGINIIKEEYTGQNLLLENISNRVKKGEYPVFVTAGNGKEKLTHIRHNRYLSYCYDKFSEMTGSLVTFGFNFGEYDDHIIDAINIAAHYGKKVPNKLWSIYIGAYSDQDVKFLESIRKKFKCKVHIFDAKTAPVWG